MGFPEALGSIGIIPQETLYGTPTQHGIPDGPGGIRAGEMDGPSAGGIRAGGEPDQPNSEIRPQRSRPEEPMGFVPDEPST